MTSLFQELGAARSVVDTLAAKTAAFITGEIATPLADPNYPVADLAFRLAKAAIADGRKLGDDPQALAAWRQVAIRNGIELPGDDEAMPRLAIFRRALDGADRDQLAAMMKPVPGTRVLELWSGTVSVAQLRDLFLRYDGTPIDLISDIAQPAGKTRTRAGDGKAEIAEPGAASRDTAAAATTGNDVTAPIAATAPVARSQNSATGSIAQPNRFPSPRAPLTAPATPPVRTTRPVPATPTMVERKASLMAERVKLRMSVLGLSQKELARRCEVNATFISDLLRGAKETVRDRKLAVLARVLRTSPAWLEGTSDDPTPRRVLPRLPPQIGPALRARTDLRTLTPDELEQQRRWDEADRRADKEQRDYDKVLDQDDPSLYLPPDETTEPGPALLSNPLLILIRPTLTVGPANPRGPRFTSKIPLFNGRHAALSIRDGANPRWMPRPTFLQACPGAYAITIEGDELSPRIRNGETILCAPGEKVAADDEVVVIRHAPEGQPNGYVARLGESSRKGVIVYQTGTPTTREIPVEEINAVNRIVAIVARNSSRKE